VLLVALIVFSTLCVTLNFSKPFISTSLAKANAVKIAEAGNYDITDDNTTSSGTSDRYNIVSSINTIIRDTMNQKYKALYNTNGTVKSLTSSASSTISDILMGQYVELDMNENETKKYEIAPAYYSSRKTVDIADVAAIPNAKEKGLRQDMVFQNVLLYIPGSDTKSGLAKNANDNSFVYDEEKLGDVALMVAHYDSNAGDNGYINNSLTIGTMLSLFNEIVNGEKSYKNDILMLFTDASMNNGLGLDYFLHSAKYDDYFGNVKDRIKSIAIFDNVGAVSTVSVTRAKGSDAVSVFALTPWTSHAGTFSGDIAASNVGLFYRDLPVALRLCDEMNLRDIFSEVHEQVQNGIKYSCYPYIESKPLIADGDVTGVLYQRDLRDVSDFGGLSVEQMEIRQNKAASQTVLDIQILDGENGLRYVFDYAASRYEQETMIAFQNLFKRVVAAIVNANTDGYTFKHLKKDVCGKKSFAQKLKEVFSKKKK
jgi:hypothetical protein